MKEGGGATDKWTMTTYDYKETYTVQETLIAAMSAVSSSGTADLVTTITATDTFKSAAALGGARGGVSLRSSIGGYKEV